MVSLRMPIRHIKINDMASKTSGSKSKWKIMVKIIKKKKKEKVYKKAPSTKDLLTGIQES